MKQPYIYTAGGESVLQQVRAALQNADEIGGPETPQEYHRLMLDIAKTCIEQAGNCREANPGAFNSVVGFWEAYGFQLYNTGGGCMAMEKTHPNGCYTLITDPEDPDVPDGISAPHMVGVYGTDGELIGDVATFKNALAAVEQLRYEGIV